MCTAVCYFTEHHYFGRNLDLDRGYGEGVLITPRSFPLAFRHSSEISSHYAMIGMGTVAEGYPLYFEATNEKGLSMAGLNFPDNAFYGSYREEKENIAPFELIPYVLSQCATTAEAEKLLKSVNVLHCSFSRELPATPLHWMISDRSRCLVMECTRREESLLQETSLDQDTTVTDPHQPSVMRIYDDPFGVLTNNPPFPFHRENMHRYMSLCEGVGSNTLSQRLSLKHTSLGFGAMGLPGDFSSVSRFVRAVFVKEKSPKQGKETESVSQFFHILSSVAMPKGCVKMENGNYEYTRYSSCCNTDTLTFYYTTYHNSRIRSISLHSHNPYEQTLTFYPIDL